MSIPPDCSHVWRCVLSCRDQVMQFTKHCLCNDEKTQLWHDPWVEGGLLRDRITAAARQRSRVRHNSK
ncbi:hypothetical protein FRX31_020894, partial [Thalictrum thalictroides]